MLPPASTPLSDLSRRFGGHFILITRAWRREADLRLAALGLSHATAMPLMLLHAHPVQGCRQHELAQSLGIEQSSLVRLLDQLAASGLLERRGDPVDRRAKMLILTPEGACKAEQADALLDTLRQELLGGADPADMDAAMRVLEQMWRVLGAQRHPANGEPG
ncbi:MarR family transcriptional regulator [Roseomonas aerophila]|uniref:MarR family transcriptional regulator n=1 Tax=Teichococcus aerophilus TaxID=1224513 RepID=A0ABR7RUC9_9PROT|nr:MarR family transcriptional regulator [Pseudoroseomonas aerophila]MBC9209725.1 MarR family transcriptional regulator [Pseudoroseomonas aerophila]